MDAHVELALFVVYRLSSSNLINHQKAFKMQQTGNLLSLTSCVVCGDRLRDKVSDYGSPKELSPWTNGLR